MYYIHEGVYDLKNVEFFMIKVLEWVEVPKYGMNMAVMAVA